MTPPRYLQPTFDTVAYPRSLIQQGEGARVEFKTSFQKEVIETLVAFANSKGGLVLVGVSDTGQVTGVEIQAETLQGWINQCKQSTSPSVIPDIEVLALDGKTVAAISVDEYPIKPVAYKGRYFKRIGNANHQMTPTEISDAHIKLINSSWDYHADPVHSIDTISHPKVQVFAEALSLKAPIGAVLEIFKELDLIEKYGSGVRRVIETCVAYGLPEPVYAATQGGMAVTVYKELAGSKGKGVNEGVNALLAIIARHPGLRTPLLAEKMQTSTKNIERWLKQLKEAKEIEFRGAPKTGGYFSTTKADPQK